MEKNLIPLTLLALLGCSLPVKAQSVYDRVEAVTVQMEFAMPRSCTQARETDEGETRGLNLVGMFDKGERKVTFRVIKPAVVTQGVPFQMKYVLDAPTWDNCVAPRFGSITEKNRSFQVQESDTPGFQQLVCEHTLVCNRPGTIPIPSWQVTVDGTVYQSESETLDVRPSASTGAECQAAYAWFAALGLDDTNLSLEVERATEDMVLFHDVKFHCFILVARQKYWSLISNRVLAYSTENALQLAPGDNSVFGDVFLRYQRQLRQTSDIAQGAKQEHAQTTNSEVAPLLGCVTWGQSEPYNSDCPKQTNGQSTMVGCVAVAISQILHYYGYPKTISVMNNYTPSWSAMNCRYATDETCPNVSQLMFNVGSALGAKYGSLQTSTDIYHVRDAMCDIFGYNKEMDYKDNQTLEQQVKLIHEEADAKRPCLISDFSHAFISDGYKGDYLHLNMGWNGFCNGYYLPYIHPAFTQHPAENFSLVISGIHP